jgi:GGDEF domain-containing protein
MIRRASAAPARAAARWGRPVYAGNGRSPRSIDAARLSFDGTSFGVTASLGVVALPEAGMREAATFLAATDSALPAAQRAGGNRVVAHRGEAGAAAGTGGGEGLNRDPT